MHYSLSRAAVALVILTAPFAAHAATPAKGWYSSIGTSSNCPQFNGEANLYFPGAGKAGLLTYNQVSAATEQILTWSAPPAASGNYSGSATGYTQPGNTPDSFTFTGSITYIDVNSFVWSYAAYGCSFDTVNYYTGK